MASVRGHSVATVWCLKVWGPSDINVISQWWHHSVRCMWHHCDNVITSRVDGLGAVPNNLLVVCLLLPEVSVTFPVPMTSCCGVFVPLVLLGFHVIVTFTMTISGWKPTCDSAHWCHECALSQVGMSHGYCYNVAQLRDQATGTVNRYYTQSHYSAINLTKPTSPCLIILMLKARLCSDKHQS